MGDRSSQQAAAKVALGALGIYVALVSAFSLRLGGPYWFLHLGGNSPPTIRLARKLFGPNVPVPNRDGHDGRAYWVVARDPLLLHGREDAGYLDRPGYRAQRVGFPLLAWPWRLVGERAVVWAMLITNVAVVGVGTYLTARLAQGVRAPPRAAFAFALSPVVAVSVLADLGDALALLLVIAGVLAIVRHRLGWATVAFAAAGLTREASVLAPMAIAALPPLALRRKDRLLLAVAPLATVAGWVLYAHWRLGWPHDKLEELDAPFMGYWRAWQIGWSRVHNWSDAALAVATLAFAVLVVVTWWRRRGLLLTAALPFALLVPFFSAQVVDVLLNSTRALGPAFTLFLLDGYARREAVSQPAAT